MALQHIHFLEILCLFLWQQRGGTVEAHCSTESGFEPMLSGSKTSFLTTSPSFHGGKGKVGVVIAQSKVSFEIYTSV